MRFVIQRVTESSVKVDGKVIGQIGKGFMVLIGVADSDTKEIADKMVKKMTGLRIFEDEEGKTNLSLDAVGGELLLISQFTLYANCKKGNRPSFVEAGKPDMAEEHSQIRYHSAMYWLRSLFLQPVFMLLLPKQVLPLLLLPSAYQNRVLQVRLLPV